ncbi:hypothetical protein VHEMI01778 [[Torrubiella] hemipterigena]|uniref:BZIP domain-containing protein n=1 Tax=[Torrubiella] hemipterigena TaxID=1531966 RepID=A0A0A1T8K5_9HYPO|nr:hypothetical protein VHEMI01778 [[Torrubiella] hemipterigena]
MSGQNTDFDALLDLSEYDGVNYQSPSLSPSLGSKPSFASPTTTLESISMTATTSQTLSGPSHNYELYRQQTGFVPGALANTMAVNQSNNTGYQDFGNLDYISELSPENDLFDFNTTPSQPTLAASDLDMDFDNTDSQFFGTVNPSNIEQDNSSGSVSPSSVSSGNGRLWPGAHSQAALAKAQAQQRQLMQQRQATPQKARGKSAQPTDPMVERKITQLLNSMRAKPASPEGSVAGGSGGMARSKKAEDDMDEDERLLASEEGKKLSSKERRQLRNKVSARAFRSRRKEYITQLEQERDNKDEELTRLRVNNRALLEENKRLSDLTRMLLSSPSFSNFLDHLSTNPASAPVAPVAAVVKTEETEQRDTPKDINPYGAQSQQQQIGFAMIPEQSVDFSMLALDNSAFNFQPQVFVVDTPELPAPIDAAVLSGKTSNFVGSFTEDNDKTELPAIERRSSLPAKEKIAAVPRDEEFEANPEFALFHSEPVALTAEAKKIDFESLSRLTLGMDTKKMSPRFELVDAAVAQESASIAIARVAHISAQLDPILSRLELLTMDM